MTLRYLEHGHLTQCTRALLRATLQRLRAPAEGKTGVMEKAAPCADGSSTGGSGPTSSRALARGAARPARALSGSLRRPGAARSARRAAPGTSRDSSRLPPGAALLEAELRGDRLAVGAEVVRAPLAREALAQLQVAVGRVEDAPDDELRRRRPVPACSPAAGTRGRSARPAGSGRAARRGRRRSPCPPGGSGRWPDAEAEVLPLADRGQVAELAAGDEEVDARVAEPERGEPAELGAERERERRRPGRSRRPRVIDRRSPSARCSSAYAANASAKASTSSGPDREAGGRAVPAEALEVSGTGGEPGVEVEGGDRAAGALPVAVPCPRSGRRAVVALDEP